MSISALITALGLVLHLSTANVPTQGDHYCGIYSVYISCNLLDRSTEFDSLLKPQYVGSRDGSTLQELNTAIEDQGLAALAFNSLSLSDALSLGRPVILHVAGGDDPTDFDHYVVAVDNNDGAVAFVDGPSGLQYLSLSELENIWSGTGIIVLRSKWEVYTSWIRLRSIPVIVLSILFLVVLTYGRVTRCNKPTTSASPSTFLRDSLTQAIKICILPICIGMALFIADAPATTSIQSVSVSWPPDVEVVSTDQLPDLLKNEDPLILDVDHPFQYSEGHLDGAINIDPRNMSGSWDEVETLLKSRRPILLCSTQGRSEDAIAMGQRLNDGYEVKLYAYEAYCRACIKVLNERIRNENAEK